MKRDAALRAGITKRRISTDPTDDVRFRGPQAVFDAAVTETTRELHPSSKRTKRPAFHQHTPAQAPTALVSDHVDHAADCVGAIKRRPGSTHHFEAVRVREQQVFYEP